MGQHWTDVIPLLVEPVYGFYPQPPISDPQFEGTLQVKHVNPDVSFGRDPNNPADDRPYWTYWDERFQSRSNAGVTYSGSVRCPWHSPLGASGLRCDKSNPNGWSELLCVPSAGYEDEPTNAGPPDCPLDGGTNPIHTLTGNKYQRLDVYQDAGPFPLNFTLHYNSRAGGTRPDLGYGWNQPNQGAARWSHTHPQRGTWRYAHWLSHPELWTGLGVQRTALRLRRPDGRVERYSNTYDPTLRTTVTSTWHAAPNITSRLETLTDATGAWNGLRYTDAQDTVETYDLDGRLLRVTNRQGLSHHYSHTGNQTVITDDVGRTLTLTRTATTLDVRAPDGSQHQVQFNADGDVTAVLHPDGGQTTLAYTDPRYPGSLTTLTDPAGVVLGRWSYDDQNRALSSEHAGGQRPLYAELSRGELSR